jgi:hypothetical protein
MNILKGVIKKRFKEDDDESAVDFDDLDPDKINKIKRTRNANDELKRANSPVWSQATEEEDIEPQTSTLFQKVISNDVKQFARNISTKELK